MSISIKNKIAYYCLIVVSIYLIIYDLCFLYVMNYYQPSMFLSFGGQIDPKSIFIVHGVFNYLAEFFRVAWVVVFLLVWKQPKLKLLLSLTIAGILLPGIFYLAVSNDIVKLAVQFVCMLAVLYICLILFRRCNREYKPLLIGQIVISLTYILLIVLLLLQASTGLDIIKVLSILRMGLSILAIIFASGRLRENRAAS